MGIVQSVTAYESWLRAQLGSQTVESDIEAKHRKMCLGPFPFLRGTYWRWAETVPDLVKDLTPALAAAPSVLAVGDIHLENFGTWRDAEGRMVWGVNDFDEAADMPYVLDLNRPVIEERLERLAAYLGLPPSFSGFRQWVLALREEMARSADDVLRRRMPLKLLVRDASAAVQHVESLIHAAA